MDESEARARALLCSVRLHISKAAGVWNGQSLEQVLAIASMFEEYILTGNCNILTPLNVAARRALEELEKTKQHVEGIEETVNEQMP
jgi:hypothetical protein